MYAHLYEMHRAEHRCYAYPPPAPPSIEDIV